MQNLEEPQPTSRGYEPQSPWLRSAARGWFEPQNYGVAIIVVITLYRTTYCYYYYSHNYNSYCYHSHNYNSYYSCYYHYYYVCDYY